MTHTFKFKNEDVKCEIPVYDNEHPKLFLKLVNEYWNMTETYAIFVGDTNLLFDNFRRCLKWPARADTGKHWTKQF